MLKRFKIRVELLGLILFSVGLLAIILQGALSTCDYWWHLKAGEWMLDHQTLPFYDVFSWFGQEQGLYWMSHEWLSEVVIAKFNQVVTGCFPGSTAHFSGYLLTCLCLFLLFGLLSLFNFKHYFKNVFVTMGWILFGGFIFATVATPRPHLISYILLALTLWSLESFRNEKKGK